ncbi:MAG: glycosyltransferase [Chromatiaceae bacterium]|nr:glycosyltransferase [Chromatiaceae bacterium]
MKKKRYSLGILQSHPTQFDGPLFRVITNQPDIDLTVYYFSRGASVPSYDREINRRSGWDHDITSGYRYLILSNSWLKRLRELWGMCAGNRHDLLVIAGYNFPITLGAAMLSRVAGTWTGLRADSVVTHPPRSPLSMAKNLLLRLLLRLYKTGHPTGTLARRRMTHCGIAADALFEFPYAVDHDYLRNRWERFVPDRVALRHAMGIQAEDFVVLGIAKFVAREDPLTLVRAYHKVGERNPNVHLILVGDGVLNTDIRDLVARSNLRGVHLPGYVDYSELPKYFALADVFVHPAVWEPWGVSVNEAMVCGLPVIAADSVGAGVDLIQPGQTGAVFAAGDTNALAGEIEHLVRDPDLARGMGSRARAVVADWGYQRTLSELRKALDYVMTKQGVPSES